jgi:PII-like signaling protein
MRDGVPGTRLMVFLSDDDRVGHRLLAEVLMERALDDGLAGATLWRGSEGFGRSGRFRTARFPDANLGLPMVVEVVDGPAKVDAFCETVRSVAPKARMTREPIEMTRS